MLAEPVLLDGGLATLLEAQGADLRSRLWSAQVLLDDPGAVVAAHATFFAAGAQVATTASYQAPVELVGLSVRLAQQARAALSSSETERWVAGSVGPYGASLADGSEYRGDYGLTVAETIPTVVEVEALLLEVAGTGVPCWLSVTATGEQTRAGEPAYAAFTLARDVPDVIAVGVNCLHPGDVPGLLALAAEASGKPGVAYPNRGEGWDATAKTWTGPGGFYPAAVSGWVAAGARLVGGCCRVTPADIAAMRSALDQIKR